jgi:hypothetical protein
VIWGTRRKFAVGDGGDGGDRFGIGEVAGGEGQADGAGRQRDADLCGCLPLSTQVSDVHA